MGRKRTRAGKYIYFCIANLIFLSFWSCATIEKTRERVEVGTTPSETKEQVEAGSHTLEKTREQEKIGEEEKTGERDRTKEQKKADEYLLRGKRLLAQGDYEGSLRENQKTLSLSANRPPGDEALFNMGLIYAHSGNPKKDLGRSVDFFKRLLKDYPQSPFVEQAKIWIGVLQENEKLIQMLEKSKEVDIQIEEKKREKAK
jgi:tetratricopeptide (TPR) repeat protein